MKRIIILIFLLLFLTTSSNDKMINNNVKVNKMLTATFEITEEKPTKNQISETVSIIKERSGDLFKKITVKIKAPNRIVIKYPDIKDSDYKIMELTEQGKLEFKDLAGNILLSNHDIEDIRINKENKNLKLQLKMTEYGTRKLNDASFKYFGRELEIYYEDSLFQTATVREAVTDGDFMIDGFNNIKDLEYMVLTVKYGSLPFKLKRVE